MWKQATWAFGGGLNNHSRAAKRRLEELVVAHFLEQVEGLNHTVHALILEQLLIILVQSHAEEHSCDLFVGLVFCNQPNTKVSCKEIC